MVKIWDFLKTYRVHLGVTLFLLAAAALVPFQSYYDTRSRVPSWIYRRRRSRLRRSQRRRRKIPRRSLSARAADMRERRLRRMGLRFRRETTGFRWLPWRKKTEAVWRYTISEG